MSRYSSDSDSTQGYSADTIRRWYQQRLDGAKPARPERPALTQAAQYVVKETKRRLDPRSAEIGDDELEEIVRHVEAQEQELLSDRERRATLHALRTSLDHYDLLTPLIENEAVNDIIVSRYDDISVQIGRKNVQTDLRFASHDSYKAFLEQLLKRAGKACTLATPVIDAAIDPHIRLCVTHESFSPKGQGPTLTLRISRHEVLGSDQLLESGMLPEVVLEYLRAIVRSGAATLLIAGEVGTGKTTLLRALAHSLPEDDAILVIEDTHEIHLDRPFTRTLLIREANTEGAGKITHADAIRAGMRMAMNRMILGEMRDAAAAEAFIDCSSSGHPGMSTIHARSARDALNRLELFLMRAQPGVGVEVVRRLIAQAVSVVVHVGLDTATRRRRVLQVVEVATSADGQIQLSPLFSFHRQHQRAVWQRDSGLSQFQEALRREEVTLGGIGEEFPECREHEVFV